MTRIDLEENVPPNARGVAVRYSVKPAGREAIIYRTPNDAAPLRLSGTGNVDVELLEPQALWFETIGAGTTLTLDVTGYEVKQ
jgi:hypothetical protein